MIYLTRKEHFNAAHRVFKPEWDDEKNFEIFGKCSNPNWHGHNYTLLITVKGEVNPVTGYLVDLKKLRGVIRQKVVERLDHRNINLEVSFMKNKIASSENLAMAIWNELEREINELGAQLHCIRLEETENNYVEFFGKK